MDFIRVLCFLSLLLAACVAQRPKPCTIPALMSGSFSVVHTSSTAAGKISYDAFGQRMRVTGYSAVNQTAAALDQLMFFKQKIYYEVDWQKFTCKKMPLDASFVPIQVPPDANLMGQVVMGSSSSWGMGILINTWYGRLPENGFYTAVYTETGCIPLSTTVYTQASGFTTISTYDWVLGISTASDFVPPFLCGMSVLEKRETPDTVLTALQSLAMKSKKMV